MRRKDLLILGASSAALLCCVGPAFGQKLNTVVSVGDGDTLRVRNAQGRVKAIRTACVDAPELKQYPHGIQSRNRLRQILPVGTTVSLKTQTTDRYGRTVAEIFKGTLNVGLAMVQEGRAIAYRKYLDQCDAARYLAVESRARQRRLAFWSESNPVMPWDFRRGVGRTVSRPPARVVPTTLQSERRTCDRAYPDVCIPPAPPDLNCKDIPFRRFRVIGSDPHRFDRDRDGVGCEG